ncbi:MAG TPA: flavin reductase [Candidatus Aenigmarchaeota archaeon]|nr:MAG: hypothetical protein DRP03_02305 [Candidatus Aenigmarchaeota archaeon]HDD45835.1 flavin reductase [Candidatus Aenigmarchaeota archaeon]
MSELTGARQVVLVTTRYEGKDNIITLAWHTPLSFEPFLYGIVIGKERYSYALVSKSKIFCVNFIPAEMKEIAIKCGTVSGRDIDKFTAFGIEKEECKAIDCARIKNCLGYLECKVIKEVEVGDHAIFVGNVEREEYIKDGKRLYHITNSLFKSF